MFYILLNHMYGGWNLSYNGDDNLRELLLLSRNFNKEILENIEYGDPFFYFFGSKESRESFLSLRTNLNLIKLVSNRKYIQEMYVQKKGYNNLINYYTYYPGKNFFPSNMEKIIRYKKYPKLGFNDNFSNISITKINGPKWLLKRKDLLINISGVEFINPKYSTRFLVEYDVFYDRED